MPIKQNNNLDTMFSISFIFIQIIFELTRPYGIAVRAIDWKWEGNTSATTHAESLHTYADEHPSLYASLQIEKTR